MSRPILVKEIRNISVDCPSKWEGTTLDGRTFSATYDFGKLRVAVNGKNVFVNRASTERLSFNGLKSQIRHMAVLPDSESEDVAHNDVVDELLFDEC